MKAKRVREAEMVNPLFSVHDRAEAKAAGRKYDVPQFLTLPVGEIVDDPECWRCCVGAPGFTDMVPHDDECRETVLAIMTDPDRKAFLTELKRMASDAVRAQLPKSAQEQIDVYVESYGPELALLDE